MRNCIYAVHMHLQTQPLCNITKSNKKQIISSHFVMLSYGMYKSEFEFWIGFPHVFSICSFKGYSNCLAFEEIMFHQRTTW